MGKSLKIKTIYPMPYIIFFLYFRRSLNYRIGDADIRLKNWVLWYKRTCLSVFMSYLTNRRYYSLVNGIKSNFGYVNCGVLQGSVLGTLLFFVYIIDTKHAIVCDNVKLFADDTYLFTNDRHVDAEKKTKNTQVIYLKKIPVGVLPTNYRSTASRQILCSFIQKNMPIPEHFDCIDNISYNQCS